MWQPIPEPKLALEPPVDGSTFEVDVLASGLVDPSVVEEANFAVRLSPGAPAVSSALYNLRLAEKLVELGSLTPYQADQLLRGNRKLNLGPYRIVDSIGKGGMGQVFKAEHEMMGRIVAVKVLPRNKTTPDSIASFTREIRAQALLDHENLVRAYDAGHDGNVYYLVTEFVPGADLRKYVRDQGPLGMAEAAAIISQAARGLEHAHRLGLVHRDVKPGNLLVTPDGRTKVSDLGLAGSLDADDPDPRAGKVVGTADYLSPEQIQTPRDVNTVSDIYSLGCTLYYAVTGKVPYAGGSLKDKVRRHVKDPALHPRNFNATLSDPFVEVMAAMMEKDSKKRIQTAGEVIARLALWVQQPAAGDGALQSAEGTRVLGAHGDRQDNSSSLMHETPADLLFEPIDMLPGLDEIELFDDDPLRFRRKSRFSDPSLVLLVAPTLLLVLLALVAMVVLIAR